MPAHVWTDEEDQAIRDGHAAGKSLTATAKGMGVAKAVVSRRAAVLGLDWDRTRTAVATHARGIDAKARRADLQLRALARAEALYARLEAPTFTAIMRAAYGEEVLRELDHVPAREERDIAATIRTHLDASLRLDAHDSAGGATAVIGILQQTAAALGLADDNDTSA